MTEITADTWWVTHKITCRGQEQHVMVVDGEVWAWVAGPANDVPRTCPTRLACC